MNLALRELSLDASFNTESLEISGQSQLGDGTAKFNGKLAWRDREPYGNLHVEGENLRVVDVPEARIEPRPSSISSRRPPHRRHRRGAACRTRGWSRRT